MDAIMRGMQGALEKDTTVRFGPLPMWVGVVEAGKCEALSPGARECNCLLLC